MCIFSTLSKDAKIKKRIAQLKNELSAINHWRSNDKNLNNVSNMLNAWQKKGRHALDHVNEHTEELKKKVKENPKTTIALAAGIALVGLLLIRKH
ncbi:DUF883 C-terminal domain-containing protein [Bartonella sp. A05]|uniref:DUF883 C-terminal domain-containing protein n=1 Tax=Bartonella sp. A05 TaxID=2967261 RepID=UPI0022A9F0B8|nr:DUF883 C-terminal domain-containing protein [Bartonella sp. A05]MCZ2203631.1 DUF883 C-terminal domain-containing protein [Bartonella sp. A05]